MMSRSGLLGANEDDDEWRVDPYSELYDGWCTFLSPRLAIAAFGRGDYAQFLSDLAVSLEPPRPGAAGGWVMYNMNSGE